MISTRALSLLVLVSVLALGAGPAADARAEEGASWRLEQPLPPELPDGQKATTPIGLGKIGDIEFWAPNRGLLITAGNPPTIPPGVWAYNGVAWHELSTVCGATDGRIAWAGPDEFWTISDGRPGQAVSETGRLPPLEDNTLCHFAGGQVVGSYASPAFQASSYQAMHGAGCFSPSDCWFAGDPLPEPQAGSFHLHWDGHALTPEPNPQGHAVEDMVRFGRSMYEGVRISQGDRLSEEESPFEPSNLHTIAPSGVQPIFQPLFSPAVPFYSSGEFATALGFPHLGDDEEALWAAANPALPTPVGSTPAAVTVVRYAESAWTQIVGASADPGGNPFTKYTNERERENEVVDAIAAEPGSESAWVALSSPANAAEGSVAQALVARLSSDGTVSERQALPSPGEGTGPKGAAKDVTCAAPGDCWLATTQGWLFHLTTPAGRLAEESDPDSDPDFSGPITFRPPDEGVPQVVPDAPPADDSGLLGELPASNGSQLETAIREREPKVTVPLLSQIHTRLKGTTLELRFRLAVKARIRLLAKRGTSVVASTPMRTFAAGERKLLLALDRRRWPTKLTLQTHALAALPIASGGGGSSVNAVSTGLVALPPVRSLTGSGPLR